MRVLLAPQEIAGYMGRLNLGLRDIGVDSRFYDLTSTYARYDGADRFLPLSILKRCERALGAMPAKARRLLLLPLEAVVRACLFLYSLAWADAIVFGFAATYLGGIELPIYKFLKKKLVFVYFGSDSRPCYMNGKFIKGRNALSIGACMRRAGKQKRKIAWLDKFADAIIDHPPSAMFHEKPFIPFMSVGMPTPAMDSVPAPGPVCTAAVVLHAPSYPECKGTARIRELVAAKKSQGYDIEYIELMSKPNGEVLETIARCSFVFDELYSDSALAGLGAEAAVLGKPTLVSGYSGLKDWGVAEGSAPPAFMAAPDTVEAVFTRMLDHPDEVAEMGLRARAFVSERWNRKEVASMILKAIEGGTPGLPTVEPSTIEYFRGWGVDDAELRSYLGAYIGKFGAAALHLDDKPRLSSAIESYVRGGQS